MKEYNDFLKRSFICKDHEIFSITLNYYLTFYEWGNSYLKPMKTIWILKAQCLIIFELIYFLDSFKTLLHVYM